MEIAEAPLPPVPFSEPAAGESGRVRSFFGDRFEIVPEGDSYAWDVSGEIGGPRHRLWLSTAGSGTFGDGVDYVGRAAALQPSRPRGGSGAAGRDQARFRSAAADPCGARAAGQRFGAALSRPVRLPLDRGRGYRPGLCLLRLGAGAAPDPPALCWPRRLGRGHPGARSRPRPQQRGTRACACATGSRSRSRPMSGSATTACSAAPPGLRARPATRSDSAALLLGFRSYF